MIEISDSVKFAIVGCGHIGRRHLRVIEDNEECELIALCDIVSREALGIEREDIPFYSSIESLLDQENEIDVVCVCTPNALHAKQALEVLEKGVHVVIEKPMALTKSDCEAIIFKSLNRSRNVFCVMQNRYSPAAVWLKNLIEHNTLGNIFLVHINCFWNRDDRYYFTNGEHHKWHGSKALDGGTLYTQFAHFIDMMYWLFGDIANIDTKLNDFQHQESTDFEDSGVVHFDFVNGGLGSLSFTTAVWDTNFESSITIVGSKGSVKVGGQYMNKVEYCHVQDYEFKELPKTNPPNEYNGYKGSAANHHYVIQNVVDVLKGRKEMTTNALEGLKVVDIIERMYSAAE